MGAPSLPIEEKTTPRNETVAGVGRDRIRLLQTVAREGGVTAGARAVGVIYRAAARVIIAVD